MGERAGEQAGGQAQDIQQVRSDLTTRIARIGAGAGRARAGDLAREIDAIRHIALANGMRPAVTVARALESALARGERGPLVQGWLALLGDAVGGERQDRAACDSYAAACSVRLNG